MPICVLGVLYAMLRTNRKNFRLRNSMAVALFNWMRVLRVTVLSILGLRTVAASYVKPTQLLFQNKTTAVVELDVHAYTSLIQNDQTNTSWLVTHYAHWCGHCINFAPILIKLAESMSDQSQIRFAAVDCAASAQAKFDSRDLCRENDIKTFPTILLFRNGVRVEEVPHKPAPLQEYLTAMSPEGKPAVVLPGSGTIPSSPAVKERNFSPDVLLADAGLTMVTLLRNEIFRGKVDTIGRADIADLIRLLTICTSIKLPTPTVASCTALTSFVHDRTELAHNEWLAQLDRQFPSSQNQQFVSCKDFSCGMWRLFHLTTLSVSPTRLSAQSAMDSTRFVADRYFACEVCRDHFLNHFDKCDFDRCANRPDAVNVPLWLMRLHNGVNKRIGKPEWPKAGVNDQAALAKLRRIYGFDWIHPPEDHQSTYSPMAAMALLFVVAAGFAFARFVNGDRRVNRILISFSKKYQSEHVV